MRVLLVDDHPLVRHALGRVLAIEPDIDIVGEAANGQQAIALTYQLHPDVVLMDVSMPVLDGIQATRAIHGALPATCVIGLSTFPPDQRAEAIRDAGAKDYVSKGAPVNELLLVMRAWYARLHEDLPRLAAA
jgi:DNA-binding NarL/FixJ family response regulator